MTPQVSSLTDLDNDHLISEHSCSSNVLLEHRTLVPVTCYLHFLLFLENHNTTNKWPTSRALTMAVSTHINSSWRTDTLWQKTNHIKASVWDRNQLKTWKSQDITHRPDNPGTLMPRRRHHIHKHNKRSPLQRQNTSQWNIMPILYVISLTQRLSSS